MGVRFDNDGGNNDRIFGDHCALRLVARDGDYVGCNRLVYGGQGWVSRDCHDR